VIETFLGSVLREAEPLSQPRAPRGVGFRSDEPEGLLIGGGEGDTPHDHVPPGHFPSFRIRILGIIPVPAPVQIGHLETVRGR